MMMPLQITRADVDEGRRLLHAITAELRAGTRHYTEHDGRELTTPREIIEEMLRGRLIDVQLPEGRRQPDYLRPV